MRGWLAIFISFLLFTSSISVIASVDVHVSPTGSDSDQNVINNAISEVSNAGGGTVYLNSGTYTVNGPVYIKSNIKLTGASDAIIKVSSSSSQWFTGSTGIISCSGTVSNVEICGFQITGNCQNLDNSLANTPGHDHDCERCIILHGDSRNYASNIRVHDMTLSNSFSDGIYIYYAQYVKCYNNLISNCQHEGIFWSVVLESIAYNNNIAGICSDCIRYDNCVNCIINGGILFSYNGSDNNGQYKNGEAGIQIGDAQASHGFNARNKPTTTTNIEVTNVTFANIKKPFNLGVNSNNNVYIHDNSFIGTEELETVGIPVELLNGNYSSSTSPSVEKSETIFDLILRYLNQDYTYKYPNHETSIQANVSISYYNNSYNPHALVYVDTNDSTCIKYNYAGKSASHYYTINEGSESTETDVWNGNIEHRGNALFINGTFNQSQLNVTCYNSNGYYPVSSFNVTDIPDDSKQVVFNPKLWEFVFSLSIFGIFTIRNLRRIIRW